MDAWASDDIIEILPPDRTLLSRIGLQNLNTVFSSSAEATAQAIIDRSGDDLSSEMLHEIADLEAQLDLLAAPQPALIQIAEIAFSLKANAGLAGYGLISVIARSLYLYCEPRDGSPLATKELDVIGWHIRSIGQIARIDLKGDGGHAGAAIRAELSRLVSRTG